MNEKDIMTEADEWERHQSTMLSKFEEIAQSFLNSLSGERGNGEVFASLQNYLDGSILVNGAYSRRRTVLLAVHDMNEELEAPIALQDEILEQLEFLGLRPVPRVRFYQDVATAILRMEVVIRLRATQILGEAPAQRTRQATELWPSRAAEPQAGTIKQMPGEEWTFTPQRSRWPLSKLATIGSGMAVAACLAGTFVVFGTDIRFDTPPTPDLAASAQTAAAAQESVRNCILSSGDEGRDVKMSDCPLSQSPDDTLPKLPTPVSTSSAPEYAMSPPVASPEETPATSAPWAAIVEADFKSAALRHHP